MTSFYRLVDNVHIGGRWHLGEVTLPDGTEPDLDGGVFFRGEGPLTAELSNPGRALDFCETSFGVPIACAGLSAQMRLVARDDVQLVPVEIDGQTGMQVMNALRVLECLDEAKSHFLKWTKDDHRADLAGQYKQVTKLVLTRSAIPPDVHIFRVHAWTVGLVISDKMKRVMEGTGCLGAKFIELER